MKEFYKPFSNGSMYDRDIKQNTKPSEPKDNIKQCPTVMTRKGPHVISRDFDMVIADLLDGKKDAVELYDKKNQEERDKRNLEKFRPGNKEG